MAVLGRRKLSEAKLLTPNDTLTSGITKANTALPIVQSIEHYGDNNLHVYRTRISTNTLLKATAADAALAFGEKIATFPLGLIKPISANVELTVSLPTGLSSTAGEVGLGTVIASGANATIGAVGASSENVMEGTTLANIAAASTSVQYKYNAPIIAGTHSPTAGSGEVIDGSATAAPLFLNIASTWDQTAAESVSFSAVVIVEWVWVGKGA